MNSSAVNMNDDCMGAFFKIGGFTANSPGFVGTNVSTNLVIFCTTKNKSGVNLVEIFEPVSTVQTVKRVHGQCILCRMIDHVHHFDIYIYYTSTSDVLYPFQQLKTHDFEGHF